MRLTGLSTKTMDFDARNIRCLKTLLGWFNYNVCKIILATSTHAFIKESHNHFNPFQPGY